MSHYPPLNGLNVEIDGQPAYLYILIQNLYMKYILYATSQNGEGHVQKIGEYEDPTDIEIHVGHFKPDILITLVDDHSDEVS